MKRHELLKQILSIPTMSFHEEGIATFVKWYALGLGLSLREDSFGNILLFRGKKPDGVVFSAHMDHPGFEVISSKGGVSKVALWGKVDPKIFSGSKVAVYSERGKHLARIGKLISGKKHQGKPIFEMTSKERVSKGDFGHFDIPAMKIKGDSLYTRAADNLMSVAAILEMFTILNSGKMKATGLFTRGEEAGFLGAFGAIDSNLIPKSLPLVVLECSSAKHAQVDIGAGPVIRVGDWQSSYDPSVDRWIHDVAAGSKFQRALLPGGRCEACVYIAEGYKTGGIALPLGNYHNQGANGPAAEYVSISDYDNMVKLMCALARSKPPDKYYLRRGVEPIRKHYSALRRKLLVSR